LGRNGYVIREMVPDDWGQVAAIYREGIATGNATFETDVPSYEQWAPRHVAGCSLVACDGPVVAGWGGGL